MYCIENVISGLSFLKLCLKMVECTTHIAMITSLTILLLLPLYLNISCTQAKKQTNNSYGVSMAADILNKGFDPTAKLIVQSNHFQSFNLLKSSVHTKVFADMGLCLLIFYI